MALIAFDGATCRLNSNSAKNSNVGQFFNAYASKNKRYFPGGRQQIYDLPGRETEQRSHRDLIEQAHQAVLAYSGTGDGVIDIAGLGCGGALALELSHRLGTDPKLAHARIRFMALWDIVLPNRELCPHNQDSHRRSVHMRVYRAAHAMALDEHRESYAILRQSRAYEVWFRGANNDVGGCNGNKGLADISLSWMLRKAIMLKLPMYRAVVKALQPDPDAAITAHDEPLGPAREILDNDRVHTSVQARNGEEHNNPDFARIRVRR